MPVAALEHARATIVDAVDSHLGRRSASAFRRIGEVARRAHVEAGLDALLADLTGGSHDAARALAYALIDALTPEGLTFSDLRSYCQSLRKQVRGALADNADADARVRVEEWFFELLLVTAMRFMAWRDEKIQHETARLGVERLESQLGDLEDALREKTQLLDIIRQASTPVAPVVRGILVVPLVGTFDAFRAELLTERLLEEVSRARARAIILDISGVPLFDTHAAQLMIRLARSVRLLGTRVFLVGMSPGNAQTIVALGIDLTGIETYATLQDGLARALVLQRLKIVSL